MTNDSELDAIRSRVCSPKALDPAIELVVLRSDCKALLEIVEAQHKALRKAHDFTHIYEDSLLEGIRENTLNYFRNILLPEKVA